MLLNKKWLASICFLLFVATNIFAQKIKVGKDGLVTADGKDVFYLIKQGKGLFGSQDRILKSLDGQDIAFLKYINTVNNQNQIANNSGFTCTFYNSENSAYINASEFNSFDVNIALSRIIYNGGFLGPNGSNIEKERVFVLSRNGVLSNKVVPSYKSNAEATIDYNTSYYTQEEEKDELPKVIDKPIKEKVNNAQENISIVNNKIYDGKTLIATFKETSINTKSNLAKVVNFTDANNAPIATATYKKLDEDWTITLSNKKVIKVLINKNNSLQELIEYLAQEKIIKK